MKKLLSVILVFLLLFIPFSTAMADPTTTAEPRQTLPASQVENGKLKDSALSCRSAILMDADSGDILYELDADSRQYPASITKIMTCILAIEYSESSGNGLSEKVTVAPFEPLRSDYTVIGMKEGEVYTLEQLLYGLMLPSGNDAAIAIADHISGSVENFAERMNNKAEALGMTNTHFVNPNGLHDENHYTTARDMVKLAAYCMKNETFRTIVSTKTYTCPATNKNEARTWKNTNRFYGLKYPEQAWSASIGIKTGYTNAALNTFVCAVNYNGRELYSVTLGHEDSTDRFNETKLLMRYGLRYFENVDLKEVADQLTLKIHIENTADNASTAIRIADGDSVIASLPVDTVDALAEDPSILHISLTPIVGLSAPMQAGDTVGTGELILNGVSYGNVQMVTVDAVKVAEPDPTPAPEGDLSDDTTDVTPAPSAEPESSENSGVLHRVLLISVGVLCILLALAVLLFYIIPAISAQRDRKRRAARRRAAHKK